MDDLRRELDQLLADGVPPITRERTSEEAREHARLIAEAAAVVAEAFGRRELECIVVGGSAVEIQVPGLHVSGDIDVVIEGASSVDAPEVTSVFEALGFSPSAVGMWERDGLYVHPCGRFLEGEAEDLALPTRTVRVASRESLIVDRIASFRHLFRHKAVDPDEGYELALQGLELLAAFKGELDRDWLENELEHRGALDVYRELNALLDRTDEHTVGKKDLRDVLDAVDIHPPDLPNGEDPQRPSSPDQE